MFNIQVIGNLKSSRVIHRHPANPILSSKDIPFPSTLVFNAGVTKFNGKYVMIFRNDYGDIEKKKLDGTNLGLAFSKDGLNWQVQPKTCFNIQNNEVIRGPYDPRLIVIDNRCYVCFALTGRHGIRAGIAVTDDFENFKIIEITLPDNRNIVLFPEKINNMFMRLDRPFTMYSRGGQERFDIWISESPDLKYWGNAQLLLAVENIPFANLKLGPAAPPIKTKKGWLTTFHAVDFDPSRGKNGWEPTWQKRYTSGIMLLDLYDPSKIIGICREPLIAPEAPYETHGGFRNNAIFPCGIILEDSGEVKIYYGAADIVLCVATADVGDLINICKPI